VIVLFGAVFMAAFAAVTTPPVLANPGDLVISGQVTDNSTSLPIANALIHVEGQTLGYLNETFTDASGNYSMTLPAGGFLFAVAHGEYYLFLEQTLLITGNTVKDVSLDPAPARTARVRGNVTDSTTSNPVFPGMMLALTPPAMEPDYLNFSALDENGAYDMAIIPGDYLLQSDVVDYITNQTGFTVGSGDTVWIDMVLDPFPPETSMIQGRVTENGTGTPIDNASVVVSVQGFSNSTNTNATGDYAINVFPGFWEVGVSANGFGTASTQVSIGVNETRWENFTLKPTTATVKGYITDEATASGIDGAQVFVGAPDEGPSNFTSTNASGYYEMRTIVGSLFVGAQASGYLLNLTFFTIADGETLWVNLTLAPEDAVLKGFVTDVTTSAPLGGVFIQLGQEPLSAQTNSNATGYYEVDFGSGPTEMDAFAGGYQMFETDLTLATGVNWFNFTMYPDLPENATVQGYVNDTLGVIVGASVRASGFGTWFNETSTDGTGFYAMNVVSASLTLFARASGHGTNSTDFTIGGGETLSIDLVLDIDTTSPNVTAFGAAPAVNVSVNNPALVTASINETWLERTALSVLALRNVTAGERNFTLLSTFPETDYQVVESSPGLWDLDFTWDAKVAAGWMGNTSGREWVTLSFFGMPLPWHIVSGEYRNASSPIPVPAQALFSQTTGALDLMGLGGPPEPVPADPTGEFRTGFMVFTLDDLNTVIGGGVVYGAWYSVFGLDFVRDDLVPSGTHGLWVQAWDFGDNYGEDWTFLDVDNTLPVADAGTDQAPIRTTTVDFDGTGSTDIVGITNYTWTFQDGGTVTLYDSTPSHTFNTFGDFEVTLTVTDGAVNTNTDTMWVNVTLDSEPPVANAGPDQAVDEDTLVTFDGSGSTDNIGISNYTWTFTDVTPQTLYEVSPTYLFANPGTYVVTLTVTDLDSNADTDTVTITVNDITDPVADAGPDQTVDEDTLVTFDGSASSDNVGITNYTWTFQDGGSVTLYEAGPTYAFSTLGSYTVTLTVVDAAGNTATDALTVTVLDATSPTADAGPDQTVEVEAAVTFDGSGSSDNVGVTNYTWTFQDGGSVTLYEVDPTYAFSTPGEYTITLTVVDAAGNEGTDTITVTVVLPPGLFGIPPLVLAAILGGIVIVVLVVGILLWRRR
jgi:PKD repeat protein